MIQITFVISVFALTISTLTPTHGAYLGNADGKVYYTGGTTIGNITAARTYCVTTQSMQLSEIRSAPQQQFLMGRYNTDFTGEYWLGAGHWVDKSQFRWTTDNSTVIDYSPDWSLGVSDTCVTYTASNSNLTNGNWKLASCALSKKFLCDAVL